MARAYVFREYGGPDVEELVDLPRPVPGPGQVLVEVRAAGVNPADWKRRTGYAPPGAAPVALPAVFGNEVSGVVVESGPGADFAPGEEVFGYPITGGYAEFTLLPADLTARKPPSVSFTDAATLPVAAATAYDAIQQVALTPGATLLITGVGGGVGVAAAQIARHAGLRVIGTASAAKKDFVASLGVIHVEPGPGTADRVRAEAPGGVDAIVDLVGGAALEEVAELLGDRAKLVTAADRATVAALGGVPVARARDREVLDAVARLVVEGALHPYVTRTFPLAEAGRALRSVEEGHTRGKVVIEIAG
ncbi:NADPH:quinone reductase [Acrocarpospora phusangensis]|uniref:NADPH:quinone reductase n=1 Tax=Acrocarpospora phusangensis TaxID=1070424 RepID=A0A919UKP6_9ACTN|nr:NADP-dependent oxidoreductase [Acrocarpospora phusangensis]GIH25234.1 NADPH:quinone reductase [Acrocarpospora phusangensis]